MMILSTAAAIGSFVMWDAANNKAGVVCDPFPSAQMPFDSAMPCHSVGPDTGLLATIDVAE